MATTTRPPIIDLAIQRKMLTEDQFEQCKALVRKSKRIGLETTVEEVLVKQGFLMAEQLEELAHIAELSEGGKLFGNYQLGDMIGQGGMGKVYQATHEVMNRIVALKVINTEHTRDKTSAARFFMEIRALAKLSHPNAVTIYDCGRVGRKYYFAMEFVRGGSLTSYVSGRTMLPEREALRIIRDTAAGLAHAHAMNITHRDVKPDNVLLDETGRPKLTDFGLVMHHDADHMTLTQEGMMVGSYYYVSPEQLDGLRDIDGRTDVYSLGATLFFALTGRTPFNGKTPQEIVAQTLAGELVSPRRFNHSVSARTERFLRRMMARNRDKRIATMEEVVEGIDALMRPSRLKRALALIGGAIGLLASGMLIEHWVGILARL
jgi:eukaryotic-like serine/threonine-protein kinase